MTVKCTVCGKMVDDNALIAHLIEYDHDLREIVDSIDERRFIIGNENT